MPVPPIHIVDGEYLFTSRWNIFYIYIQMELNCEQERDSGTKHGDRRWHLLKRTFMWHIYHPHRHSFRFLFFFIFLFSNPFYQRPSRLYYLKHTHTRRTYARVLCVNGTKCFANFLNLKCSRIFMQSRAHTHTPSIIHSSQIHMTSNNRE